MSICQVGLEGTSEVDEGRDDGRVPGEGRLRAVHDLGFKIDVGVLGFKGVRKRKMILGSTLVACANTKASNASAWIWPPTPNQALTPRPITVCKPP